MRRALAFSPDGSRLAVADIAGDLQLLDLASGQVRVVVHAVPSATAPRLTCNAQARTFLTRGSQRALSG